MQKKIYKTAVSVLAIAFILTGVGLLVLLLILAKRNARPQTPSNTMIILGAQVKGAKGATFPSQTLKERLDTGIEYLVQHPEVVVIVAGGRGDDEADSEAAVMAQYLEQHNISFERIILEDQSTTTKENLIFANRLKDLTDGILVTSDFHMYRSLLIAHHQGLHLQGLSAKTNNSSKYYSYLRETLALAFTFIKIYL